MAAPAAASPQPETLMRKLLVAFLLPKLVSYLRRRYSGRPSPRQY